MINVLVNIISIFSCVLIGLVFCGAVNICLSIIKNKNIRIEYYYAVLIGLVSIACNILLLFVLINIKGL